MRLPAISGIIDRRILANYRIDAEIMAAALPRPFRPQLFAGYAIGGICLIRLKKIKPAFLPVPCGINSENSAHRIAVKWDTNGGTRQGVYIPRRDTDSSINTFVGGKLFPGIHHEAIFDVIEEGDSYSVSMRSNEGNAYVHVSGSASTRLNKDSIFGSIESASDFFEKGSLGYSDTGAEGEFDGLELKCRDWQVENLDVEEVSSSYFDDESRFPKGSVQFDCALLMRNISHEWQSREQLCCPT